MGQSVDAEVVAAFDATVKLLVDLGHAVIEAGPPVDRERFSMDFITVLAGELRADLEETAEASGRTLSAKDFDPQSFGMGMAGRALSAVDYARAARRLFEASRAIGAYFEQYDVQMTPTLARPPIMVGELQPSDTEKKLISIVGGFDGGWLLKRLGVVKQLAETTFEFMPWTAVYNVTGQPAMSVPSGMSRLGLPIGMQFAGRFGDEATLFSLAGQLEEVRPWKDIKPSILIAG
jgi:amidase